jgi:hypothetical protein
MDSSSRRDVEIIDVDALADDAPRPTVAHDDCLICSVSLTRLNDEQRAQHYDAHYPPEQSTISSTCKPSSSNLNPARIFSSRAGKAPASPSNDRENIFWRPISDPDHPPNNFTPGCLTPLFVSHPSSSPRYPLVRSYSYPKARSSSHKRKWCHPASRPVP